MKKLVLIILGIFIFTGCVQKEIIVKKDSFSPHEQKQNANKAWKDLDKEK